MQAALQVYMRNGCHLCEDMLQELTTLRPKFHFGLEVVDITGDAALEDKYGTRVPVLCGDETEICYYFLDQQALSEYFSAS